MVVRTLIAATLALGAAGPWTPTGVPGIATDTTARIRADTTARPSPHRRVVPSVRPARGDSTRLLRLGTKVFEVLFGEATYYHQKFTGRLTASGVPLDENEMVAAHRTYPFGTVLRVTNLRNKRSVVVRVIDRGPFGRLGNGTLPFLDLSRGSARYLGMIGRGHDKVKVEVLAYGAAKKRSKR